MSLILDLIFPKICYGCGKTGDYFCSSCQKKIPLLSLKPPQNGFDGGLSLVKYHSLIESAITDLKYNFVSNNSSTLVNFLAESIKSNFPNLLQYWQQNNFILIPIPLYQNRQNWRGFNQSELLGQKLAKKLSLNYSNQILTRHRETVIQARLKNLKDRQKNVSDIFSLSSEFKNFKDEKFIIFDDVSTTQSTLISAKNTLKSLSPKQCWYLTLSAG